jgi:DNA polymerase III delta subunit
MAENKNNAAWVSGAYYLARPLLSKIREKFEGAESFDCYENTLFSKLMTWLSSNSCFADNRLIVIHALPKMTESEKDKFKLAIEKLDGNVWAIFFMINPSDARAIYNTVKKFGKLYEFEDSVVSNSAIDWINKRARELGFEIEQEAVSAIAENAMLVKDNKETALDPLESTLQRLTLYAPGKKTYSFEDVISTAAFYNSFIIWSLMNACDERNYEKCLNAFSKCVASNSDPIKAINEVLPMMAWKYRMLLCMKELLANGASTEEAVLKTSSIRKVGFETSGLKAITKTNLIESGQDKDKPIPVWNQRACSMAVSGNYGRKPQVELYSRKDLYLIVKCIEDCLILARTCASHGEAGLIADIIFMTICSVADSASISKILKSLSKTRI